MVEEGIRLTVVGNTRDGDGHRGKFNTDYRFTLPDRRCDSGEYRHLLDMVCIYKLASMLTRLAICDSMAFFSASEGSR